MLSFKLNENASVDIVYVGNEVIPVIVIDNFCDDYDALIQFAVNGADSGSGSGFSADVRDFYPGMRKPLPESYTQNICQHYLSLIKRVFQLEHASGAEAILSALSIAVTPPGKLRPIQTLPHFDSPQPNQLAIVHYLCDKRHGGTSFYRHRETGFETINSQRLARYGALLKQQAIDSQLHKNLSYIDGDNPLFERVYRVEAKMNRVIIYPSNALHSGDIQPQLGLSADPHTGRLTTSSFIIVQ